MLTKKGESTPKGNIPKICVIGLDGMGLSFLRFLCKKANLPSICKIVNHYSGAPLSIPPYTPIAWTTIFTGVNPGKHNIYSFVKPTRDRKRTKAVSSLDVAYPRIFEIFSMYGCKSVVVNVPLTWPYYGIVGRKNIILVSDWLAPKQRIFPKILESKYSEFLVKPPHNWRRYGSVKDYVKDVLKFLNTRLNIYYDLLESYEWNLFTIVFSETDWILHVMPEILLGKNLDHFIRILDVIDRFIKRALEISSLVILTSDHNFSIKKQYIDINNFLHARGMLDIKYTIDLKKMFKRTFITEFVDEKSFKKGKLTTFAQIFQRIIRDNAIGHFLFKYLLTHHPELLPIKRIVNISSSVAFSPDPACWGVYILHKNLEKKVIENLRKVPGVQKIIKNTEIFYGPYASNGPDLILLPDKNTAFVSNPMEETYTGKLLSHHYVNALFAMKGDNVLKGNTENIVLSDIVPSILYYSGLPIPKDMDGKVLTNAFDLEIPIKFSNHVIMKYNIAKRLQKKGDHQKVLRFKKKHKLHA